MHKGYKRNGKAIAVLHFFIGLILVAILLAVVYFFLEKMDYTDKLADPQATQRAYVEMTANPDAALIGGLNLQPQDTAGAAAMVDLTTSATPEPTAIPTPTPTLEPTPIPTPTPVPTPTPTPTPVPTKIPAKKLSKLRTRGFNVPVPSTNATLDVTNLYISEPNNSNYVQIQGYAYLDEATYDASTSKVYLIVTQKSSGRQVAYTATMTPGISGDPHTGAQCANPASADFDVILNASKYTDGEYGLGVVLYYNLNGSNAYSYHELDETFSVQAGKASVGGGGFSAPAGASEPGAEPGAEPGFAAEPAAEPTAQPESTPAVDAFGAPLDGSSIG